MSREQAVRLVTYGLELMAVSVAYLAAFYLTFDLWQPLQDRLAPDLGTASLLFLPHGIRVVVAWLYGLRGIALLLPAAAITHYSLFGLGGFTSDAVFGLLTGASVAPIVFYLGLKLNFALSVEKQPNKPRHILIAGMVAACVNALLTNLAYGAPLASYLAYVSGDFFGQLVCFYVMIFLSRGISRWRRL